MKKLKLLVVSALLVVLATGCGMKAEYNITISKDSDVRIDIISAMDDEMIDAMINMGSSFSSEESESEDSESKTYTDEERWQYVEKSSEEESAYDDYKKVKYNEDGYKGYAYNLNLGKIDDLVAKDGDAINFEEINKDAKLFTKKGNVYTLRLKQNDADTEQMKQNSDSVNFDVKLKVHLPYKAKSNNATKVDGTTYIWDLTKAKDIKLSFTLDGKSSNNTVLIIGGACACAGIVICSVALVLSKKKKKKAEA